MTAEALIAEFVEFAIRTHRHPKVFREALESGYCERMLKVLGPDVFDPDKRVRLVLAGCELLRKRSEGS